ncbi:MAG: S24 family peptidase [Ethanoligenens sp.]
MKAMGALLRAAREAAGISVEQISKELESRNVKASKKTIYSWENDNSQPTPDPFLYMCTRYGIANPTEYFGYETIGHTAEPFAAYPTHYISLRPEYRAIVDAASENAYGAQLKTDETVREILDKLPIEEPDNLIYFPLSDQAVSAGTGVPLGPDSFTLVKLINDGTINPQTMYGVPVRGDSMEPEFHDGDILLVRKCQDIGIGQYGIFTIDGDGYVKEKGHGELISLNPKYKPIKMDESIRCHGEVLETIDTDNIIK